jgi:autophagy-related protein 13
LDTSDLTSSQSLVLVDDHGKHRDVAEALSSLDSSKTTNPRNRRPRTDVVLERWTLELKGSSTDPNFDYSALLPTVYKKGIVFFRTLFTTARFVPAYKFRKNLAKAPSMNGVPKINCRIINGEDFTPSSNDALNIPLFRSDSAVTSKFVLGDTDSPAGRFSADVEYRNDCNFRIEDSEALLSERFMGVDESYVFQPSLASRGDDRRRNARTTEMGSLPVHRRYMNEPETTQAYGSLSTFHGDAPPLGTSPISALRAAKTMGSDTSSPPLNSVPYSRSIQPARPSSSRALEGIAVARRPSVSFNPFKAGSLSGSPGLGSSVTQAGEMLPPGSPHSLNRNVGNALTQARNRSSLTAGMPSSLRGGPIVSEHAVASSSSSSPKPAPISRYSSSFSHRRGRLSYGGTSKADDDQGSSGKQSLSSSSAQPGSGILADGGASSGSLHTDDDNISDFLKYLDSNKNLPSFQPSKGEAAGKRTTTQLSRFQMMRESNNILSESLSSSMLLQRSSTSLSRQLSSVPQMVAATSISTSSSPGKPVSPHTPHTPAIPSRLSANSIVEYAQTRRVSSRSQATESHVNNVLENDGANEAGTNAIDIPTSPRPLYYTHNRRSSSVAQQNRSLAVEDDNDLPFHRSISLGADDREPPSLSDLLGLASDVAIDDSSRDRVLQPAAEIGAASTKKDRRSSSPDRDEGPQIPRGILAGSINAASRSRAGRPGVGRGITHSQAGSYSSLGNDRGSGSEFSGRPHRYSFTRPVGLYDPDDEPLLFDMSEIGRDREGRRSLEEGRGGGSIGADNTRGGYATRGCDSGNSSRRGSRW